VKPACLHLHWRDPSAVQRFRCGVSLHSHTLHSEESLAFVPRYTGGVPLLSDAIRQQEQRYLARTGQKLDFSRAFWRPPLSPRQAFDVEKRQIEDALGLDALVSLTDHDDVQAGLSLAFLDLPTPISVEWTIPFGPSFFHVGLHNLPTGRAQSIISDLVEITANPSRGRVRDMLASLHERPETLIIWNHPVWDEARVGAVEHAQLLGQFLERFGDFIHALELNGLRPWSENRQVVRIAAESGQPVVSGGDRHGLEPNANINLTNAGSFEEFVEEIRIDKHSDVLFLSQYREPLRARMIETMWDIVREYPDFPESRRNWSDRVFHRQDDGVVRPLSAIWKNGGPWPVKWFLHGLRATKHPQVRSVLRLALADGRESVS